MAHSTEIDDTDILPRDSMYVSPISGRKFTGRRPGNVKLTPAQIDEEARKLGLAKAARVEGRGKGFEPRSKKIARQAAKHFRQWAKEQLFGRHREEVVRGVFKRCNLAARSQPSV